MATVYLLEIKQDIDARITHLYGWLWCDTSFSIRHLRFVHVGSQSRIPSARLPAAMSVEIDRVALDAHFHGKSAKITTRDEITVMKKDIVFNRGPVTVQDNGFG